MSVDVPSASCTVSSPFRRCRDRISLTRSGALTGHTPNASPGWYRMPESDRSISMCSTSFSALREVIFWRTDRLAVKGCSRVQTCAAGASAVATAASAGWGKLPRLPAVFKVPGVLASGNAPGNAPGKAPVVPGLLPAAG